MLRGVLTSLAVFSYVLMVAVALLWLRSLWISDYVEGASVAHASWYRVESNQGRLFYFSMVDAVADEEGLSFEINSELGAGEPFFLSDVSREPARFEFAGFLYDHYTYNGNVTTILGVPYWALLVLLLVAPAWRVLSFIRRWRVLRESAAAGGERRRAGRLRAWVWLFGVAAALVSHVLAIGVGVMWVRSLWITDVLERQKKEHWSMSEWELISRDGGIQFRTGGSWAGSDVMHAFSALNDEPDFGYLDFPGEPGDEWHRREVDFLGFRYAVGLLDEAWVVGVPYWFLFVLVAALPCVYLVMLRRRWMALKAGANLCWKCGYDLRGVPAVDATARAPSCPECGAARRPRP